ncbi:MAG: O-antigen ligase family protein [bacterium]|nr:O-antigen ligase family protein [bacterium]
MNLFFEKIINNLNKPKSWLILVNVALVLFLIIFNNLGIIPLRIGDFVFFAILTLFLALYRPGWAFLFFVGTIALENINLAPLELGIAIRPYQFIGALTITAIIIRLLSGKLNFKLVKLEWYDWLIVIINIGGLFSIINASNKILSLKLAIILATFSALYFLVRNYIQNIEDLKKVVPFFLSSSLVVVFYGIWQNIWFLRGLNSFETMPGRPNATFSEADWLGIFIVLVISLIYVLIYYFEDSDRSLASGAPEAKLLLGGLFLLLTISYVLLILTVSRSAWLGAFAVTFIFLFTIFTNLKFHPKNWQWRETIKIKLIIVPALFVAVGLVYIFHLTNFQLFNRVQSTGSGMQKITVSCNVGNANLRSLPKEIENISELEKYSCRHINLEEIEIEKNQGNLVTEIFRKDPNISIRSFIYQRSWQEIKNHPILGIGWGSIGKILGEDGRGMNFNSSNIFLEIWLGSGILGFASFVIMLSYILGRAIKEYYAAQNDSQIIISLFLIISWFAIIVPNFFNAGIFLGFFWLWLGIAQIKK